MAPPKEPPVKPVHIALICVAAVVVLFVGSIVVSVAVVQSAPSAQQTSAEGQ